MPELGFCRVVQKFVFFEDYQKRKEKKKASCLRELSSTLLILDFVSFDWSAPSK